LQTIGSPCVQTPPKVAQSPAKATSQIKTFGAEKKRPLADATNGQADKKAKCGEDGESKIPTPKKSGASTRKRPEPVETAELLPEGPAVRKALRKPVVKASAKPEWGKKSKPAARKQVVVSAPGTLPSAGGKRARSKVNTAEPETSLKMDGPAVVQHFVRDVKNKTQAAALSTAELLELKLTSKARNVCGGQDDKLKVEERVKLCAFLKVPPLPGLVAGCVCWRCFCGGFLTPAVLLLRPLSTGSHPAHR